MENYKSSMVIYESAYLAINYLPNTETKWEAIEGLLKYGFYGEIPESNNPFINMIYVQAIPSMQNAKQRYEKAIENGAKGGRPTEVSTEHIIDMKKNGMTNKEISEQLGCSVKNIENRITTYNKSHPNNPNNLSVSVSDSVSESYSVSSTVSVNTQEERRRGEKRDLKDLTEEEAKEIINKLANDVPYSQLYKEYNLKRGIITKNFTTEYREAKEQALFEERKIDYEFLTEYWQVADSNIAKARMKQIIEKYPQYTHDQLMSAFHNNPKLSYEHFWDTVKKKQIYNWTSQQYEDGPVIPYPQWLHERISNGES